MRVPSIVYSALLLVELLRLYLVAGPGSAAAMTPMSLGWYAGLALLCLPPVLIFMLVLDEERFRAWLPLLAFAKGIGLPAVLWFFANAVRQAARMGLTGDMALAKAIGAAALVVLIDLAIGIFALVRGRVACT